MGRQLVWAVLVALGSAATLDAQEPADGTRPVVADWLGPHGGPIMLAGGRVTLGGDISSSVAPEDTGFFNYTDYDHSTLRTLRLALSASVKAGAHLALLTEIRSENGDPPEPYALYLRFRPWVDRRIDIQAGRVPPTFGAFARRTYPSENPLIGYPLAYQYLTSLRPDALPASVDELLAMRGRGWLSSFSLGNLAPEHGVPVANVFRWDTGVQVHAENDRVAATVSATTGTLSDPGGLAPRGAPQLAGRAAFHPLPGLVLGASASRGSFVSTSALAAVPGGRPAGDFAQTAWGGDVEYSAGYYLVRAETVISRWRLPIAQPSPASLPLAAAAAAVEGRYRLRPGLYAAGRIDRLAFSEVNGSALRESWDAPVTRWEAGVGYSIDRNLLVKVEYQHNVRDGGRVRRLSLTAAQLVFWF